MDHIPQQLPAYHMHPWHPSHTSQLKPTNCPQLVLLSPSGSVLADIGIVGGIPLPFPDSPSRHCFMPLKTALAFSMQHWQHHPSPETVQCPHLAHTLGNCLYTSSNHTCASITIGNDPTPPAITPHRIVQWFGYSKMSMFAPYQPSLSHSNPTVHPLPVERLSNILHNISNHSTYISV